MIEDPIVEEVRRVRDELVKRYGGLDGLVKHLQGMDQVRLRKAKERRRGSTRKQALANARSKPRKTAGV